MKAGICAFVLAASFAFSQGHLLAVVDKNYARVTSNKLNVSQECSRQLEEFESSLSGSSIEKDMWAWKMVDATSKLQSGLLEGNFNNFGAFDECVRIKASTEVGEILGKYCLGTLTMKKSEGYNIFDKELMQAQKIAAHAFLKRSGAQGGLFSLKWSACLPSGCTANDFNEYFAQLSNNVLQGFVDIKFVDHYCQTKNEVNPKLEPKAIVGITIFSIIAGLVCISTLYDLYVHYIELEPAHIILIAFSAYTNGSKLFTISTNNPEQLSCLNGLRVISIMWVVIGHQYSVIAFSGSINFADIRKWMDKLHSMYIVGATISVDTFFVLSGLLMTYGFLKAMSKGIPFNIPLYWLHRYLRLTPALAAVVLMDVTLNNYFGSGPMWPDMKTTFLKPCTEYWWSALLYLQNYVNPEKICIAQSWYLSVDMQLFILSPLVLLPLWKWKRVGLAWLCFLFVASVVTPFVIAWEYDMSAQMNVIRENPHYMTKYYYPTHTRAAPWLIGIFVGYLIFKIKTRKEHFKMNKLYVLITWAACLAVLITCVLGGHNTLRYNYNKLEHVSHVTFVRPAWAIALGWLIVACVTGYGGPINWFLSFPAYQVLGRLTYCVYLLHSNVLLVIVMSSRISHYFSDFNEIYLFWGLLMFATALSVVWVLAFESPMITIEKVLFHQKKDKPERKPKTSDETIEKG